MLVWLTGWSAGTLFFDGMAVWVIGKQIQSQAYNHVPGIVTKSEVRVSHDSEDGDSYHLDLEYTYEVDGVGYTCTRQQYGFALGSRRHVQRLAKQYAVDSSVDVYYRPADPEDAVLVPGLSTMDFFLPLFLVPFNVVMIGVFSFTVGARVRSWFCKRPVTIKVWQRDVIWYAKVYQYLPIAAAGVVALATSFLLTFVVGFGQLVLPGWILIVPGWCIVILGTLLVWFNTNPKCRLEIDEFHGRLTLKRSARVEPERVDTGAIQSVDQDAENVVLNTNDSEIKLACGSVTNAAWLSDWLRVRFGLNNTNATE